MIEVEIKHYVHDPETVTRALESLSTTQYLTYSDTYLLHDTLDFSSSEAELRIREVREEGRDSEVLLTYKSDVVDRETESKHEYECTIASSKSDLKQLFLSMNYYVDIEFEKYCNYYVFEIDGRTVAATVVTVNELPDTFIEIEILTAEESNVNDNLSWLENFAARHLGLSKDSQTTDTYMGQVAEARASESSQ